MYKYLLVIYFILFLLVASGCAAYDEQFSSYCRTNDSVVYAPVNGTCPYALASEIPQ